MARRKAAGKDSRAARRRPAGGGRKATRKPTARKVARKKRAAKAAPPRKRPPAKARKPRLRAAPRPGGRVRKAARKETIKEILPEEPDVAMDPSMAEQARGETALLGRGPNWWNSSLGGSKPGARVPPALRRGARTDGTEAPAVEPPIPIGIFALRESAPPAEPVEPVELDVTEEPESRPAMADMDSPAMIDEAIADPADVGDDDDEALDAVADEARVEPEALDETPPRQPAAPQSPAVPVEPEPWQDERRDEPVAGIAAERDDEPADAGLVPAAASGGGVMQMLLGNVARSRPDGPGAVPPPEPVHATDRAVPPHAPADAPRAMPPAHGAKGASAPFDDDAGLAGRKLAPADLEALDAEIASSFTGLDGLDGAGDVPPRDPQPPRGSAGTEHGPAEPGPRPHRPTAHGRDGHGGASGDQPRAARMRGGAGAAPPAKRSPSALVAALAAFNYPLRGLPPPARRIVGWIAASLLLWVPIVWLIALYFIG